jgi:superfamily II DNA/RNA helicase
LHGGIVDRDKISCYQEFVYRQVLALQEASTPINYPVYVDGFVGSGSRNEACKGLSYCYEFVDITRDSTLSKCKSHIDNLVKEGILIELGRVNGRPVYTTLHADLIFRVIRGRAYADDLDSRWVGRYDISVERSYLPDFSRVELKKLEELIRGVLIGKGIDERTSARVAKAVADGLRSAGYSSLAVWQFKAIESILKDPESFYVVDAPTAAGKTLVFMIPAIVCTIISKLKKDSPGGALLVYPRKALQRQQLENLLRILHHINKNLRELNLEITVAVDKGVEEEGVEEGGIGKRKLFEIDLGEVRGKLVQRRDTEGKVEVLLELPNNQELKVGYFVGIVVERKDRDHILMQNPDILITNPWTIRERIKSAKAWYRDPYIGRSLVVLDEVHVYTNVNYLELIAVLKLYRSILAEREVKPKFILSSATILLEDKGELARWVWGICRDPNCENVDVDPKDIKLLEYSKLEPENPNTVLRIVTTLLPHRLSIETIMQGVLQLLAVALASRKLKSIVFVDSISEVSTLMKYARTIFHDREGVEICDHVLSVRCRDNLNKQITEDIVRRSLDDSYSDYSWSHLWIRGPVRKPFTVSQLLESIKSSLNILREHHGALPDDLRREIEQGFAQDMYKILIATSTLDLGVDFGDVTFIVQYKPPSSDEALIQRVGRAGRSAKSYRTALAFYIPLYTPIHLQAFTEKPYSKPSGIALPHASVINKIYLIERLEYEVKENLRNSLLHGRKRELSLKKARNAALQALQHILQKKGLMISIPFDPSFSVKLRDYRKLYKSIMEVKKNMIKLAEELKVKCTTEKKGIGPGELLTEYIKSTWLKELSHILDILDRYRNLPGLSLLQDNDVNELLKKLNEDISSWAQRGPKVNVTEDDMLEVYTPYPTRIPISELIEPRKCREGISKLIEEIDSLVKYVNDFVSSIRSKGDLIILSELSAIKRIGGAESQRPVRVNIDSLDYSWYFYIRDEVLRYLRLYLGLTSRGLVDGVKLRLV